VHGGRHGRYLRGKGRVLADRRSGAARTHGDINDTLCHLQALCHSHGEGRQACVVRSDSKSFAGSRAGFRQYLWGQLSCTTLESWRDHCGRGFSREHRRSRCHSPRRLQANAVPHAPMQRSPSLLATSLGGYCRKASEMAVISCVSLIGSSPGKRLPLQSTS